MCSRCLASREGRSLFSLARQGSILLLQPPTPSLRESAVDKEHRLRSADLGARAAALPAPTSFQ